MQATTTNKILIGACKLFLIALMATGCKKEEMSIKPAINNDRPRLILSNMHIVFDGNSLTYGTGSTNEETKSYPAQFVALPPFNGSGIIALNKGVPAQTTQLMIADATTDIDPNYDDNASSVIIAWEIGNDIYYYGDVGAAMTRFWSYCDLRREIGWKILVITNPPRNQATAFGDDSETYNAKLSSANILLRSDWPLHADGIIDVAADAHFAGYDLKYYYSDKVHCTDAGYLVIANLVRDTLFSMI